MRILPATVSLFVTLLRPTLAWAGWGDENWGEMVWESSTIPVPSMSTEGLIALAILLIFGSVTLLVRRRSRTRP